MNKKIKQIEVDMHIHSFYSDAADSPKELAKKAKNAKLKAVCLTDHDAYQGLVEFQKACNKYEIDTLSAIEVTTNYKDIDIHILGYGINWSEESILKKKLQQYWDMRNKRARKILQKYAEKGLMNASFDDVKREINCIGPYVAIPYILQYRIKGTNMAYHDVTKETKRGGIVRVGHDKSILMSPQDAVELINKAGGKAVLAHPGEFSKRTDGDPAQSDNAFHEVLNALQKSGLFGIEAYYSGHTPEQNQFFSKLAKKRNLFITAGSDYHGYFEPQRSMGMYGMSYNNFLEMKKICYSK